MPRKNGPDKRPRPDRSLLVAIGVLVWALVGAVAVKSPWYEVVATRGAKEAPIALVRGDALEGGEGRIAQAGLALAALVAGYRAIMQGRLAPIPVALGGAVAAGAVLRWLWVMRGRGKVIREVMEMAGGTAPGGIGGGIHLAPGPFVALGAGVMILGLGLLGIWWGARGRG